MAVAAGAADPIPVDTRNYTDIASDGDETSDMGGKTAKVKQKVPSIDAKDGNVLARSSVRDHERKIGHRRVDHDGVVTYKKKPTSELMTAMQLGIGQSVGGLSSKPERDVLMQDFAVVESVFYPREGSNLTPAHHCSDFRFKTYAPVAFRYFRELFDIQPDDFMLSLCHDPLRELSNPGASGSIFYITDDDEFIIKTLQHKEADFLQKLLPGYFLNISQNPRTLLPKFYGLYCYQCGGKNIRFIVMNNLLPSVIAIHEKYDLKGSTYKRKASKRERLKANPTYKDLDFQEFHPEGILLEKEIYDGLIKTLQRDCRVLESFKIMDYSLLVGIHNLDKSLLERGRVRSRSEGETNQATRETTLSPTESCSSVTATSKSLALQRGKSFKTRLATGTTPLEAIRADVEDYSEDTEDIPPGGIPARNSKGERMFLYLGIIDILQSYRLKKKLEHSLKSIVTDGDTISVHRPSYYANRYLTFFSTRVFRKVPTPLKHSPSKKRGQVSRPRAQSTITEQTEPLNSDKKLPEKTQRTISFSDECNPALGGKPDIVPTQTRSATACMLQNNQNLSNTSKTEEMRKQAVSPNYDGGGDKRSDVMTATYQSEEIVMPRFVPTIRSSPPLSLSESTPTHTDYTEGTPSFTTSSPSCSSDVLGNARDSRETHSNLNSDHGPYNVSFALEQLSPSKKANSSSEVSNEIAVETNPECTESLQEAPSLTMEADEAPSLTMEADESLTATTPQVPNPHVMHVHDAGQHALAVVGGDGASTNRDNPLTKGSNPVSSLIIRDGDTSFLNNLPKGHNSISVGTGAINAKSNKIRTTQTSKASVLINKSDTRIKEAHSYDDFDQILSKVDFDDEKRLDKRVKFRRSRPKLKAVSTGSINETPEPVRGSWTKPSFVHMSLPGSDKLFGHMMTASANLNDDSAETAEMTESTDL